MAGPLALIGPAIKALGSTSMKKAAMGAAKGVVKDKAKDFVTGKKRKGKGGDLTKTEEGVEEQVEAGKGGAIVPTTPMVGSYKVETVSDKPDEVGKPSKVSYESINNQLDSIIGLTNVLKKTSAAKLKNSENRRKAERKSAEKDKKRQRESLLERGAGMALGVAGNLYGKATQGFDPLKFFAMIFLGNLFNWVTTHGSKIIGFLKAGLALFNNAGKLLKSGFSLLGKTFKAAFKLVGKLASPIIKLGKGIGDAIRGVGKKLGSVFGKVGKSLKNFAKGILNRLKSAGKLLTSPLKALQGLTGPEKKAVKTNKGLNKLLQKSGTGSQNLGTAMRKPGTLSNATRAMRLKHGDEAARMYQGLVDNGMKPGRASRYVNDAIDKGKLTSAPLQGNLAGGKKGSQLFKGGIGRSTNRIIAKVGGKNALKATKALKNALGRIPIVGGLITLVVSLLSGDPVSQALFKTGGAVLGGFLGSFIPIPVVGTLMGELIGEYVGDLMYTATMGGGVEAVGQKLKDDLSGVLSAGQAAVDWVGKGFGRLYEGIPKINVPFVGKFPNPLWMTNPLNLPEKLGVFHKAFFTDKPMQKGKEEETSQQSLTNASGQTGSLSTQAQQIQSNQYYEQSGVGYFDSKTQQFLGKTEEEARTKLGLTSTSVATTSNAGYWAPLLETIAKKESVGGSYDSIYPGTTKQKRYGGKALTEMTISEADAWQASTYKERGSSAAGRYQFMNILSQAKAAGLKGTDMFSPENQDKMAISLIVDKRKITPQMIKDNPNEAMIRLGMEWAAFPMPVDMQGHKQFVKAGQSYYAGDGRNASGATVAEMRAALNKLGAPPLQGDSTAPSLQNQSEGEPVITSQETDSSESVETPMTTPTATLAQVSPSTQSQTQMTSGITGISQQLSYEETGNTIIMVQGSNDQQTPMISGGRKGTPIIMGSGDVVNSYYKSQVLGFLYKRG